jgi:hypothetical protein
LAGADNLGWHSATTTAAATGATRSTWAAEAAPISAAGKSVAPAKAVTASKAISAELGRSTVAKGVEPFFAEPIPLVAPPAATPSVVTHLPNVPSFRPHPASGVMDEKHTERLTEADPPHYRRRLIA